MENLFETIPTESENYTSTEDQLLQSESKRDSSRTKEDAERDSLDSDTKLKKELASRTFSFMERFVCLIFIFVIYYICYFAWFRLEIPKEVIIALITTSLATVIGLVGFILKGLFGAKE